MSKAIGLSAEQSVKERYEAAAKARESALCCPVEYEARYLEIIPEEVIEKDYGCGDPARYLREGEVVLDLGSGTGKICFIAAQVVGREGKVIGIDMTEPMLEIARRNAPVVAERLGYENVEFRKGRIQDLRLDLERFEEELRKHAIRDAHDFLAVQTVMERLRETEPLIPTGTIDVVVSNCVLNLVEESDKRRLFQELYRVLRQGGRAVISDIVSDRAVPTAMREDPALWSGCLSGAFTESGFMEAFALAGFKGARMLKRDEQPWRTVEGIEFRSVTVQAFKGEVTAGEEEASAAECCEGGGCC